MGCSSSSPQTAANNTKNNSLLEAASNYDVGAVQLLLTRRADVHARGHGAAGWTALHESAAVGGLEVVKLLLVERANINIRARSGETPLHVACGKSGHLLVVKLLIESGADTHADATVGVPGGLPLHAALRAEQHGIAALLLAPQHTPDVLAYMTVADGPPLHWATRFGHLGFVRLLLDAGAPIDCLNATGKTAVDVALRGGVNRKVHQKRVLDFFLQWSAEQADKAALKRTYRLLALRLHPDKCADPRAGEAFKQVTATFASLSNPDSNAIQYRQSGSSSRASNRATTTNVSESDMEEIRAARAAYEEALGAQTAAKKALDKASRAVEMASTLYTTSWSDAAHRKALKQAPGRWLGFMGRQKSGDDEYDAVDDHTAANSTTGTPAASEEAEEDDVRVQLAAVFDIN